VKIIVDTNVLIRAMTDDEPRQGQIAQTELAQAEGIALALPALCELVWVLSSRYKFRSEEIARAIRRLIEGVNVMVDRPAVEAGLAFLDAGGDFADGLIAYEGRWLGADTFVSFDRKAVTLLLLQGEDARLLA
jgi:predicted nucleic-acid-binding protein